MTPPPLDLDDAAREAVLAWYAAEGRTLAFRATSDPWAILVSEYMAQQTQAARAAEAWTRFMAEFPTPAVLAASTSAAVLRAWRGLGYNRRALALRAAAQLIVEEHEGRVPDDLEALRLLPGVGPYTARAVAALAFGQAVGAVDTNVRRVLGRAVGGSAGVLPGELQAVADRLVPRDRPGFWTHALMDIGATSCKPRAPRCDQCPLQPWCRYAAEATADAAVAGSLPPSAGTAPRAVRASAAGSVPRVSQAQRAPRAAGARTEPPFRATSRWLRGRILDRLRDASPGSWVTFEAGIGDHDVLAVSIALSHLARERLVEYREGTDTEVRLPEA